ncbi:hypothetical protein NBRC3284_2862 [Acetobacter pasteurianus NBRC 3284]|nr:hypothetical protein NBRC3284_2862 [Acetobacter pasteurianus NBRC 3284]
MAVISMKGAAFLMAMDTVIGGIHIQNDPGGCVLMLVKEERDEQGSQGLIADFSHLRQFRVIL